MHVSVARTSKTIMSLGAGLPAVAAAKHIDNAAMARVPKAKFGRPRPKLQVRGFQAIEILRRKCGAFRHWECMHDGNKGRN